MLLPSAAAAAAAAAPAAMAGRAQHGGAVATACPRARTVLRTVPRDVAVSAARHKLAPRASGCAYARRRVRVPALSQAPLGRTLYAYRSAAAAADGADEGTAAADAADAAAAPSDRASTATAPNSTLAPVLRAVGITNGMWKYYVAFLLFGCAVNTIGPMLPTLATHVGLSTVQMGPLLTAKGFGGLAGSFICPFFPLALLMPGGLLCIAACFAAVPFTSSLLQLAVVYTLAAAVYQAVSISAHTLIAQQHGDAAGPHLNGINALFGAGSLLAPALHAGMAPRLAASPLASPLASYWLVAAAAAAAALPFVAAARRGGGDTASAAAAAHGDSQPKEAEGGGAWSGRQVAVVLAAMALVGCNVGAENCFGTWLYTYAVQGMGLDTAAAATAVSLFWRAAAARTPGKPDSHQRGACGGGRQGFVHSGAAGSGARVRALRARDHPGRVAAARGGGPAGGRTAAEQRGCAVRRGGAGRPGPVDRLRQQRVAAVALRAADGHHAGGHPGGGDRRLHGVPARGGGHRSQQRAGDRGVPVGCGRVRAGRPPPSRHHRAGRRPEAATENRLVVLSRQC